MLKARLITGSILIVLVILAIWFLPWYLFALATAVLMLWCAWEWTCFLKTSSPWIKGGYVLLVALCLMWSYWKPGIVIFWVALAAWVWAAAAIISYSRGGSALGFERRWSRGLMGVLAIVPCWVALNLLRNTSVGPFLLLFPLLLIWAVDTGAYAAGRLWGKHHLASLVSPKKTWEGFAGGIVLALIVGLIVNLVQHVPVNVWWKFACFIIITALFAVVGDLLESLLKRIVDIKDTGSVLPGHGGVLDRMDSMMAALPIFFLVTIYWI